MTAWTLSLDPAAQSIDRSAVLIDSVRRGNVTREVRGPGTLVPEHIRWITAQASARVERLASESGKEVGAGDLLLELSNPDLQIQTMQAEQQVRQAQIELLNLTVLSADPIKQQLVMRAAMRPEFERGRGSGQWHGGPIAAIIDTVGDYALVMLLGRPLPTVTLLLVQ